MESQQETTYSLDGVTPRKRILIVEDDVSLITLWDHILQRVGGDYQYEWVANESDAETKIEQSLLDKTSFDLIISDIFLSGPKTGIDLWRRFSPNFYGRFILMSAIAKNKIQTYLGTSGALPVYIQKPLEIQNCIETVYFMLHKNSQTK